MNLARLAAAIADKYPVASIVDIGANVGDTAALVRSTSNAPVLCIEGDNRFFEFLRRNAGRIPEVHLENTLVGAADQTVERTLITEGGTGRLTRRAGASTRLEALDTILHRWPSLVAPRLVKIDTDGFDCEIIAGAADTWSRLKPVLFFEYDPAYLATDFRPIPFFNILRDAGYGRALVYDNTGEFLISLGVDDAARLEDIHCFFSGRRHSRYADIAVFPTQDGDLAESFRRSELAYFAGASRA